MLCHRHDPRECDIAFAAWRGFQSPLRHRAAWCSCRYGGHGTWWRVEARDAAAARRQLPPFVAERTEIVPISEAPIP